MFTLPPVGRVFEADMENPNGDEGRGVPQSPEARNDDYCLPSHLIAPLPKEYQLNYRRQMRRITEDGK